MNGKKLYLSKFIFINSFNNIYLSIITSYLGACDCRISRRCWLEYEPVFYWVASQIWVCLKRIGPNRPTIERPSFESSKFLHGRSSSNNWPSFLASSCILLLPLCISSLLWLWYLNGKKCLWEFWEPPLMELVTGRCPWNCPGIRIWNQRNRCTKETLSKKGCLEVVRLIGTGSCWARHYINWSIWADWKQIWEPGKVFKL